MLIGDRVYSEFFGEGIIQKMLKDNETNEVIWYLVKFDLNPQVKPNPCIVSPYGLKQIDYA